MYSLSLYFFFPFFSFHSLTSLLPSLSPSLSPSPPSFLPLLYPPPSPPSPPPLPSPSPLVMMYNQLIQTQDYTFDDSLIPSLNIPDMVAPPPLPPKKRRRKVERDRKTERQREKEGTERQREKEGEIEGHGFHVCLLKYLGGTAYTAGQY